MEYDKLVRPTPERSSQPLATPTVRSGPLKLSAVTPRTVSAPPHLASPARAMQGVTAPLVRLNTLPPVPPKLASVSKVLSGPVPLKLAGRTIPPAEQRPARLATPRASAERPAIATPRLAGARQSASERSSTSGPADVGFGPLLKSLEKLNQTLSKSNPDGRPPDTPIPDGGQTRTFRIDASDFSTNGGYLPSALGFKIPKPR